MSVIVCLLLNRNFVCLLFRFHYIVKCIDILSSQTIVKQSKVNCFNFDFE